LPLRQKLTRRRFGGVGSKGGVDAVGDGDLLEGGYRVVRHEVVGKAHGDRV
jgi:hypothetical protein